MKRVSWLPEIRNVRPRRMPRSSCGVVLLLTLAAAALGAQAAPKPAADSAKAAADSLQARLDRAEEAIRVLQQQVADQAGHAVQTRSRFALEFNGLVLVTGFSNSRRVNNVDLPVFVLPDTNTGLPQSGAGMAIRQTRLGLSATAPDVLGAKFEGDLDVDFFGGQQSSNGGRTFPLLRLRTTRMQLTWKNAEVMIGQETPLFSDLNPISLAAVGSPEFSASGNLWLWLPQIRAGVHTSGPVRVGVQGAVLAPTSGDPAGLFSTDNDQAEKSSRPFLEGRTSLGWGEDEMAGEIGVAGHYGWFATKGDSLLVSSGWAVDAKLPLTRWLEIRGEGFTGQALKGLGGGGVGQGFGVGGAPVHTAGGWAQVNLKPDARVIIGGGYGYDDPRDSDLLPGGRLKNATTEVHLHYRPVQPVVIGLTYRRLETTYASGKLANDHLNLALGFEF